VCSICKSCVFSSKWKETFVCLSRSLSLPVCLSMCLFSFLLHILYSTFFFLQFFSCCAIFVLILKLYIIILLSHSCTHKSHAIDSFLLCMHTFVFCSLLSLSGILAFPAYLSFFSFLFSSKYVRFHGVFIGCSRSYLSILYFALFFCCVRARCLERIYIHYIWHSDQFVTKIISIENKRTNTDRGEFEFF
jgi:hypothetical protein